MRSDIASTLAQADSERERDICCRIERPAEQLAIRHFVPENENAVRVLNLAKVEFNCRVEDSCWFQLRINARHREL